MASNTMYEPRWSWLLLVLAYLLQQQDVLVTTPVHYYHRVTNNMAYDRML
jgi:hypothetical protein